MRLVASLGTVLVLMIVGACSAPPVAARSVFPPRPTTISVDTLDPCSMFDEAQKKSLGFRSERPRRANVEGQPSPGCIWLTSSDLGYAAQTFPISAEDATIAPAAAVIQVNGFGAVRDTDVQFSGGAPTCQVTIDAAPAAAIRVQVSGAVRVERSDDEMCRLATEAASMVMTTVVRTSG